MSQPFRLYYQNGQQQFIVFLHLGTEKNTIESWNHAVKTVYGFETVDALEDAWLDHLTKAPRRLPAKSPPPVPHLLADPDPDLIPPAKIPLSK